MGPPSTGFLVTGSTPKLLLSFEMKQIPPQRILNGAPHFFRLAAVTVCLALLLGVTGGCQPRELYSHSTSQLLPAERDTIGYRKLVLPNQLKVILVSNPNALFSAAALAVGIGSLGNPENRPGLVHFLEHMLFLGTKKYPDPSGFSKYMTANTGRSNAYTADDHTNYFFQISNKAFEEGLDRFAHFFIDPLFDDTYAEREMKAVDSEHAKNMESDYWRMQQVKRIHFDQNHPISRFSTGNSATLRGVGREELQKFHRRSYSSNRMTLTVVGNRSLDQLEKLVRERFNQIPNHALPPLRYSPDYLRKKEALRLLRIVPVADLRQISLHFPLPPVVKNYDSKPLILIGAILGHEGKGSLLSLLKADGLATSLSAGGGENTADYASLDITVGLTQKGLARYQEVVAKVLGVIDGLKKSGIPRYFFEERKTMAALNERFKSIPGSGRMARRLSAMMLKYPLASLPNQPLLLTNYEPDLYQALMAHLTADNMLVALVAKGLPTSKREFYYGVSYGFEDIGGKTYSALNEAKPDPRWRLPQPNRFIPGKIALEFPKGPLKMAGVSLLHRYKGRIPSTVVERLLPLKGNIFPGPGAFIKAVESSLAPAEAKRWLPLIMKDALPLPQRLLDTSQAKVWWLADWRLRQPKAEMVLKFYVENAYASPREAMLSRLYEAAIEEELNELSYPIKEAGLHYEISAVKGGIAISLGGYSARMLDLLQLLIERLRQINIKQETFDAIREGMVRGLENQKLTQPFRQAQYFGKMLLETPNFTREALLIALRGLTLSDVKGYANRFLRRTYLEGVVVGNLSQEEARAGLRKALDTLQAGVLPQQKRVAEQVRLVPVGSDLIFSKKIAVNNSVTSIMYQLGPTDPALRGALLIISKPLGQQFYSIMRTRQQLGYIVWGGMNQIRKKLFLFFLIQSGQYSADVLMTRMESFIPDFVEHFKALPKENFERFREAVIKLKLERDKTLAEIANRLFWVAFQNDEQFDYVSRDIEAVRKLTRAEVEAVLVGALVKKSSTRLTIHLTGRGHSSGAPRGKVVRLPASAQPPQK